MGAERAVVVEAGEGQPARFVNVHAPAGFDRRIGG